MSEIASSFCGKSPMLYENNTPLAYVDTQESENVRENRPIQLSEL
jgi:hypothetical protein